MLGPAVRAVRACRGGGSWGATVLVQLHSRITMRKVIAVGGTAGFLVVGHEAGWLRTASLGTVLFALLGAFAASELVTAIVPARRSQAGVNVRVATQLAAASVVIYLTGCGPVLGAGYLYLVADAFRKSGARAERPLLVWLVVCIAAGQAA